MVQPFAFQQSSSVPSAEVSWDRLPAAPDANAGYAAVLRATTMAPAATRKERLSLIDCSDSLEFACGYPDPPAAWTPLCPHLAWRSSCLDSCRGPGREHRGIA